MHRSSHPINQFLTLFNHEFSEYYFSFLNLDFKKESKCEDNLSELINEICSAAFTDLTNIIGVILIVLIKFYKLNLRKQDCWKDILLNLVTDSVLRDSTYFSVYNLLSKKYEDKLNRVQEVMEKLKYCGPQEFGVENRFAIDLIDKKANSPAAFSKVSFPYKPYSHFIPGFIRLTKTESIICKLEYVFQLMTKYLSVNKDIYIDADNHLALMRYIVVQSSSPKIFIDVLLCNHFTPDSIRMTNRMNYINLVEEPFEFLEGLGAEGVERMQKECVERLKKEEEAGCYKPSSLLTSILTQNTLNTSKSFQKASKSSPDSLDKESIILQEGIDRMTQNYIGENEMVYSGASGDEFKVPEVIWNFYEDFKFEKRNVKDEGDGEGEVEEEFMIGERDDGIQSLYQSKERINLISSGLIHVNPFKETIFQSSSCDSEELNLAHEVVNEEEVKDQSRPKTTEIDENGFFSSPRGNRISYEEKQRDLTFKEERNLLFDNLLDDYFNFS